MKLVVVDKNIDFAANVVSGARGRLSKGKRTPKQAIEAVIENSDNDFLSPVNSPRKRLGVNNFHQNCLTPEPRKAKKAKNLKLIKSDQDLRQQNPTTSEVTSALLSVEETDKCRKEFKGMFAPLKWMKSLRSKSKTATSCSSKSLKSANRERKLSLLTKWFKLGKSSRRASAVRRRSSKFHDKTNDDLNFDNGGKNNLVCVQQLQLSKVNC